MSARDLLDRIIGGVRGRASGEGADVGPAAGRDRGDPTHRLPVAERPGAVLAAEPPARVESAPEAGVDGAPPPATPAGDAPTEYPEAVFKQSDVVGVLVVIDGELKGEVYRLFDGENKLGRADTSDVVLPSRWISREHAMLVHQEGVFAIVPLTEKNRTYVNDVEVDGVEVSDGDTIRLGHTTFRFKSVAGP